ncbi:MAG: GatB/YqeY domain-containing protein [Candidatus Pacearchaeota archaeon]|jgi:hypothetical protein|nr:GatB/YqeY domain-containing protein [Clostridia bacterium]
MTLKETIATDRMTAMKQGNSVQKNVLSTLLSEVDKKSKEPKRESPIVSDTEVQVIIKKLISSNIECNVTDENIYLECYLPKMLNESELQKIIEKQIKDNSYSSMKDMGKIMSYLTSNYTGQYDGKVASELVKKSFI